MSKKITIAVDAMGGDNSPSKIINGIVLHSKKSKNVFYKIFGDISKIEKIIPKTLSSDFYEIVHTTNEVKGTDSPLSGAKKGKDTSMWLAVESVKRKESDIIISAGNTGALFVIAKLNLKMIENIDKPALSGLWPNKHGTSIVLDLGANLECNEKNLADFCLMGSALFKSIFPDQNPNVALLNIGSEEIKGTEIIKNTYKNLSNQKNKLYDFKGHIEGNEMMNGDVNVIVTDGFSGNIALKTAEGTANFITKNLKNSLSKLSLLFSYNSLKKFRDKLDPRKYNGAIFLGLQGPVVKSHGSIDSIGFAHSINVCNKIVKAKLIEKIESNLITVDPK